MYVANKCSQNYDSHCNFPYSYGGIRNRILSGGYYNFKVQEIEVFKIEFVNSTFEIKEEELNSDEENEMMDLFY